MGAERRVVFVTGAAIAIGEDQKTVSAIRSYPNRIPMPEHATRTILDVLEPYGYDRLYGSFGQVWRRARGTSRAPRWSAVAWICGDILDGEPMS